MDEHINKMRTIQRNILDFIRDDNPNFKEMNNFLIDINVQANEKVFIETIHLIVQISNNHHHTKNFFSKIEHILRYYKEELKRHFSNYEIFCLFKYNKRILLFLIEEGIFVIDEKIADSIQYKSKYPEIVFEKKLYDFLEIEVFDQYIYYFYPELKTFIDYKDYELPEDSIEIFNQKRKNGENDNYICQLIRNDSLKEFVEYIQQNNMDKTSKIQPSIYETNSFLLSEKNTTVIEYAAFFGSINIVNYLIPRYGYLDKSVINYAAYSNNEEVIKLIEENILVESDDFLKHLIKSHSNNLISNTNFDIKNDINYALTILESFNYEISNDLTLSMIPFFDYPEILKLLFEDDLFIELCNYFDDHHFLLMESILGNLGIMKFLLEKDHVKSDEDAIFAICIPLNRFEIFELLMKYKKIDVNTIFEEQSTTFLNIAIQCNNKCMVKFLLQNKDIDVNIGYEKDNQISPPIFTAIDKDNIEILKILLERNDIDVNRIVDGYTPLSYAFRNEKKESFKFLINHPKVDINLIINNETPIIFEAIENDNIEVIRYFLNNPSFDINQKYPINPYETDEYPLFYYLIILLKDEEIINILINHPKFDLKSTIIFDDLNLSLLTFAFCSQNSQIVKYILQNKLIDININEKLIVFDQKLPFVNSIHKIRRCKSTYLILAIEMEDIDIIKMILDYPDIDINDDYECFYDIDNQEKMVKKTPLYCAVENNLIEAVELLLQFPQINVNIKSINIYEGEETPLIRAIKKENITNVQKLLENDRIDVNLKKSYNGEEYETPLIIAVLLNNIEITKLLLSHPNIDINLKSKYIINMNLSKEEVTPLQCAIINNLVDIINLLISSPSIDINEKLNYEWNKMTYETNSLGVAILNSNTEITNLLLNHQNIDVNFKIKTDTIETYPLTLAVKMGNINIINLLLSNQNIDVNCYHSEYQIKDKDYFKLDKMTALHIAVENGKYEIAELLIKHPKLDVNIKAFSREMSPTIYLSKEKTALHMAVKKFTTSFTKLLLSHPEIIINCKDENGCIPKETTMNLFQKILLR